MVPLLLKKSYQERYFLVLGTDRSLKVLDLETGGGRGDQKGIGSDTIV